VEFKKIAEELGVKIAYNFKIGGIKKAHDLLEKSLHDAYEKGVQDSFKAVTECPPVEAESFFDARSRFRNSIWKLKRPSKEGGDVL
jgi:hypothetical protein